MPKFITFKPSDSEFVTYEISTVKKIAYDKSEKELIIDYYDSDTCTTDTYYGISEKTYKNIMKSLVCDNGDITIE